MTFTSSNSLEERLEVLFFTVKAPFSRAMFVTVLMSMSVGLPLSSVPFTLMSRALLATSSFSSTDIISCCTCSGLLASAEKSSAMTSKSFISFLDMFSWPTSSTSTNEKPPSYFSSSGNSVGKRALGKTIFPLSCSAVCLTWTWPAA